METTLWVIGLVIVILGATVGWCFHATPGLQASSTRSFLSGLFGLPAAVGLGVLFLVLFAFNYWGR